MSTPQSELPDTQEIRRLAEVHLPHDYSILDVRCHYGCSDMPSAIPEDYEVTIEYTRTTPENLRGTLDDIASYQSWAHALTQDIRTEWPPESIRICFSEKENS